MLEEFFCLLFSVKIKKLDTDQKLCVILSGCFVDFLSVSVVVCFKIPIAKPINAYGVYHLYHRLFPLNSLQRFGLLLGDKNFQKGDENFTSVLFTVKAWA